MSREAVSLALFQLLTGAVASSFAGEVSAASPTVVTGIASTAGVIAGLPFAAPGSAPAATIASVDSASQVTLSDPVTPGASIRFDTGFRTTGRRLKHWSQVADQPALFLVEPVEDYAPRAAFGIPAKISLEAEVWLYSNLGEDPDIDPATGLNGLIDAIEAALAPSPATGVQNLGGLVQHVWIEGRIEKHAGDLAGQALAVVPLRLLVPSFLPAPIL